MGKTKRSVKKRGQIVQKAKAMMSSSVEYGKKRLMYAKSNPLVTLGYATWILWYILVLVAVIGILFVGVGFAGLFGLKDKMMKITGGIGATLGLTATGLFIASAIAHVIVSFLVKRKLDKSGHVKKNLMMYVFAYHWAVK